MSKRLGFAGLCSCAWSIALACTPSSSPPAQARAEPEAGARDAGGAPASGARGDSLGLPATFRWTSSAPLVAPIPDATHPILSVKDPSIVQVDGRYHVFATTANTSGAWSMVYLSFTDWAEAAKAPQYHLDQNPGLRGYHCAPHVFFFRPQKKWYLVFQSGQPQYSTNDDLSKPESWTAPKDFFAQEPAFVKATKGTGGWLDFWVICDAARCHLFFTDDNGHFYRSETPITSFPNGFGEPVLALGATKADLFEGGATYAVQGKNAYLTLIEAFGPTGNRYYRSFAASSLDGPWLPLADTWQEPFAGINNVSFADGVAAWTKDVSHGELLRVGYDETMTVDVAQLRFLYQGVDPTKTSVEYFKLPYRLGLLTGAK